ncbi:MAG TPA: alanine--tRNA ligase [Gemmatimonadetes bacterium]|nr:alanine--tRNA ligase [Gemmatimonadota bacterium]
MKTAEIRNRFLSFFEEREHTVKPSSSLVPADDPTLLFTNAGMVQFKNVFLGHEELGVKRAATSQKCVRAGGKHNDLEEVGRTNRHHTFFEMLGNFSFGDYFKRDAIRYAFELLTDVYGLEPERLYATVHDSDDEAADLWLNEIGLPADRVYRLGDKDNFWQMADTGPCGPCSELHYDLRDEPVPVSSTDEFVELNDAGTIVELWNLVFMQFDRDAEGNLHSLPAPCVDTGAGLERIAAVLQGADSNYHTDAFIPLLDCVAELVGEAYDPTSEAGVSYRVLADHARAVAFLLSDGVHPSNEGRGYVLRRILRRGVRHAWLLGRREPTLAGVVETVIETMRDAYPSLAERREHILETARAEEERFLSTIEGGLARFDELAASEGGVISGDEAFKLYDTFGFPLDLTQLLAEEREVDVDVAGFQAALETQRARSRADRVASNIEIGGLNDSEGWIPVKDGSQTFVGYTSLEVETTVLKWKKMECGVGVVLEENPFYVESGGQVSDTGVVCGNNWSITVDRVGKTPIGTALFGQVDGIFPEEADDLPVTAFVATDVRFDTTRNHTATHLLHAALRSLLGGHVVQKGSLVAPDRLRFDFAHTAPMTEIEKEKVERFVNEAVWKNHPVEIAERRYDDAVKDGAMALFGEKYADEVRVVDVPGISMELCGGAHVSQTGDIGLFRIISESGVASGVRRIEALTGRGAFSYFQEREAALEETASVLKTRPDNVVNRVEQLLADKAAVEGLLDEARARGSSGEDIIAEEVIEIPGGGNVVYRGIRLRVRDLDDARKWGDKFLAGGESGIAALAVEMPGDKRAIFTFASDDMISRGIRADAVIREVASVVGSRGGGRPHMAQAGIEDASKIDEALIAGADIVRDLCSGAKSDRG